MFVSIKPKFWFEFEMAAKVNVLFAKSNKIHFNLLCKFMHYCYTKIVVRPLVKERNILGEGIIFYYLKFHTHTPEYNRDVIFICVK